MRDSIDHGGNSQAVKVQENKDDSAAKDEDLVKQLSHLQKINDGVTSEQKNRVSVDHGWPSLTAKN